MSSLSALGSSLYQPSRLSAYAQQPQNLATAATPSAVGGNSRPAFPIVDPVSLSNAGIDLSNQALSDRANQLGSQTVDLAQQFVNQFAGQLFGDNAKGATVSFDSASIETESDVSAQVSSSSGPQGTSNSASFSLNDSTHFIGKGKITTADGQQFDFEIEVDYKSSIQAGVAQTSGAGGNGASGPVALPVTAGSAGAGASSAAGSAGAGASSGGAGSSAAAGSAGAAAANGSTASSAPGADGDAASSSGAADNTLPTLQLPSTDFSGGLADLFKLLGQVLHATISPPADAGSDASNGSGAVSNSAGGLSLRLLKLVSSSTKLDGDGTSSGATSTTNSGNDTTTTSASASSKAAAAYNQAAGTSTPAPSQATSDAAPAANQPTPASTSSPANSVDAAA